MKDSTKNTKLDCDLKISQYVDIIKIEIYEITSTQRNHLIEMKTTL